MQRLIFYMIFWKKVSRHPRVFAGRRAACATRYKWARQHKSDVEENYPYSDHIRRHPRVKGVDETGFEVELREGRRLRRQAFLVAWVASSFILPQRHIRTFSFRLTCDV